MLKAEKIDRRKAHDAVRVNVICSGQRHTIEWTPRGKMRLLHHSRENLRAQITMQKLAGGATDCRCLRVLQLLRDKNNESMRLLNLDGAFREPRLRARQARDERDGERRGNDYRAGRAAEPKQRVVERYTQMRDDFVLALTRAEVMERWFPGQTPSGMRVSVGRPKHDREPDVLRWRSFGIGAHRGVVLAGMWYAILQARLSWLHLHSLGLAVFEGGYIAVSRVDSLPDGSYILDVAHPVVVTLGRAVRDDVAISRAVAKRAGNEWDVRLADNGERLVPLPPPSESSGAHLVEHASIV